MAATRRILIALALVSTVAACGAASHAQAASGGVRHGESAVVEGDEAKLVRGRAVPPASAPRRVARAIAAANRIVNGHPYCYGGGHRRWEDDCYDCSGSISYALGKRGARLIKAPMPSGPFMGWGKRGRGRWITVYANRGHMYAVIAGLRLDTSMTAGAGPGWSATRLHQRGYRVRHARGL
jgi:hypothetical protein